MFQIFSSRLMHARKNTYNIIPFVLSCPGNDITKVKIVHWNIKIGDNIKRFDQICEIQFRKENNIAIKSQCSGIVTKIHYENGNTVELNKPLVDINIINDSAHHALPSCYKSEQHTTSKIILVPAFKRLIRQYDLGPAHRTDAEYNEQNIKEKPLKYLKNTTTKIAPKDSSLPKTF